MNTVLLDRVNGLEAKQPSLTASPSLSRPSYLTGAETFAVNHELGPVSHEPHALYLQVGSALIFCAIDFREQSALP